MNQQERMPVNIDEVLNLDKDIVIESVCIEADRIINGDRMVEYGPPTISFAQIATIATIFCCKDITATDIGRILLSVKIVREANQHKRDNLVDICGYADLLNQLEDAGIA